MKFVHANAWVLGALVVAGGAMTEAAAQGGDAGAGPVLPSVLFMADAQIHNVYGGQVFQTTAIADKVSHVAQRHPEINLLSRYALQDFIARGEAMAPASSPPMMVMLGDAANAACTGEYERFMKTAKGGNPERIVLIAHGNHDSYLMGTINYYQPVVSGIDFGKFRDAVLPVDESWWPPVEAPKKPGSGWRPLCYQDQESRSAPMHKIQWMAKYLNSLAHPRAGGAGDLELLPGAASGRELSFSGTGRAGTPLGALAYRVRGVWIRPEASGIVDTYNSFLVQAVDVGQTHRLILVDTAACANFDAAWTRGLPQYARQNAGFTACMRKPQLDAIEQLADESRESGRKLVFAGHHPLKDFQGQDRAAFMRLMNRLGGEDWTYVSAHTHASKTETPLEHGAKEINIGSTTDWPMSAFRIQFGPTITAATIPGVVPTMSYEAPKRYRDGPELCRHLHAAEKLAQLDPGSNEKTYRSPGTQALYDECKKRVWNDWSTYAQRLSAAERKIEQGMADERFRQRALNILSAASLSEYYTVWHDVPTVGTEALAR